MENRIVNLIIYVAGSLKEAPRAAGYILEDTKTRATKTQIERLEKVTARQAETSTLIKAVKRISPDCPVHIYSNFPYSRVEWASVKNWANNAWRSVSGASKLEWAQLKDRDITFFPYEMTEYANWLKEEVKNESKKYLSALITTHSEG